MVKKSFILVLVVLSCIISVSRHVCAEPVVSSQEWVQILKQVFEKTPYLKNYEEDVLKAERELKVAKASLLPHFTLQNSLGVDLLRVEEFNEKDISNSLLLDWNFFQNGEVFIRIMIAKYQIQLSRLAYEKRKVELAHEIKGMIVDLFQNKLELNLKDAELKLLQKKVDILEEQFQAGKIKRSEWIKEKMNFLNLQNNFRFEKNTYQIHFNKLQKMLNQPLNENLLSWDALEGLYQEPRAMDVYNQWAAQHRQDVLESQIQVKISESGYKLAKWKRWPQLSLFSGSDFAIDDVDRASSDFQFRTGAIVRFPLYDGGFIKSQILLAELGYKRSKIDYDFLIEKIQNEVVEHYEQWQAVLSNVEAEFSNFELADEETQKAELDYQQGKIAQLELEEIALNKQRAELHWWISKLALLKEQIQMDKILGCVWMQDIFHEDV